MTIKNEEILTFEIYNLDNEVYILSIPVRNLIEPKFMIIKRDLIILLSQYTKSYIVNDIPDFILSSIINKNCYLKEGLNSNEVKHLINLI